MNFFLVGLEIHEKADGGIRFAIPCAANLEIYPEKRFLFLLDKVWNWNMLFSVKNDSQICIDKGKVKVRIR